MKFAFLLAAVSAIQITKEGNDSANDPTANYSIKVNDAHNAIMAKSDRDEAARKAVISAQEASDEWRKKFNPNA